LREWMDDHLPPWVLGVIDWPGYRLFSRCWVCGRLMVLHTPWALFVCERLPMPIEITEQGMELLRQDAMRADLPDTGWQTEQVVPVSHARPA
jgi:hypothetical protein